MSVRLSEGLCVWFRLDGENCDEVLSLTPVGLMCWNHQRELWRAENR